jgi:hypothetical protein
MEVILVQCTHCTQCIQVQQLSPMLAVDSGTATCLIMHSTTIFLCYLREGTGSSNLAYPNFVSLTRRTHHILAHLSVTQSQEKSGSESQRIRLPPRVVVSGCSNCHVMHSADSRRLQVPAPSSSSRLCKQAVSYLPFPAGSYLSIGCMHG